MKNLKIFTNNIEQKAKDQIDLLLEQEAFKKCKVRIMPDVHAGAGCVIGFTADLGDKVIPNVVGVDVGCGMPWVITNLRKSDVDLKTLDEYIRLYIPSGMCVRLAAIQDCPIKLDDLCCYKELKNKDGWLDKSMGTLGGGNHFIEIDENSDGNLIFVVHSGSRNLGKQVCDIYQKKAIEHCSYKEEMAREKAEAIKYCKDHDYQQEISKLLKEIDKIYQGLTKLPKDFKNECTITTDGSIIKDYCSNAMPVLEKLLLEKYVFELTFETAGTMVEITAKQNFNNINVVGHTIHEAICRCAIECLKNLTQSSN